MITKLAITLTSALLLYSLLPNQQSLHDHFEIWLKTHQIRYGSMHEKTHRFQIWMQNHHIIQQHNQANYSTKLGLNRFSDLSHEEFNTIYGSGFKKANKVIDEHYKLPINDIKESIDWRDRVSPIKDQGACGSCWAISAVGALEGTYTLKTNDVISLSAQQLVDCCRIENYGCNGGDPQAALKCIVRDGIIDDESYPYTGVFNKKCGLSTHKQIYKPSGFQAITPQDPIQLKAAVNIQPISVCINSDASIFQSYKSGIIQEEQCRTLNDHCVLLVGYGSENGQDYWIVKNSWGQAWGEQGYFRLSRNDNQHGVGTCGVQVEPSLPEWNNNNIIYE